MICHTVFHTWIFPEVCRNVIQLPCSIILLRLLGVDADSVPCTPAPRIRGERLLHPKAVICFLGEIGLGIPGFQDKLSHGNGCQDAALLLVGSEEGSNFFNNICFRQAFERGCLQAGFFPFILYLAGIIRQAKSTDISAIYGDMNAPRISAGPYSRAPRFLP